MKANEQLYEQNTKSTGTVHRPIQTSYKKFIISSKQTAYEQDMNMWKQCRNCIWQHAHNSNSLKTTHKKHRVPKIRTCYITLSGHFKCFYLQFPFLEELSSILQDITSTCYPQPDYKS